MSEENEQFIDGVLQDSLTRRELATLYSHSADAVIRLEKITRKQSKQIRDYEAALEKIELSNRGICRVPSLALGLEADEIHFAEDIARETLAKWKR